MLHEKGESLSRTVELYDIKEEMRQQLVPLESLVNSA
jgi:hypothetical protein